MPWFPDFVNAVQLARRQARSAQRTDAVTQYVIALQEGNTQALETLWPGDVVVHDPRAGRVSGHDELTAFVKRSQDWLAEREARVETVAATATQGRAVVELSAHLTHGPDNIDWPVAIVADSPDDRSVVFRTYCSLRDVDGLPHIRSPILAKQNQPLPAAVSSLLDALAAGDAQAAANALAPTGYFSISGALADVPRGTAALTSFFSEQFSPGGCISLQPCSATDDGIRCAVEFNCAQWGTDRLSPQAGIAIFERGGDDLLAAVRLYHDIETPRRARQVAQASSPTER